MKKRSIAFPAASALLAGLLLFGCSKHDIFPGQTDKVDKLCDVTSVSYVYYPGEPVNTGRFYYNKLGDPIRVTFSASGTGRPDFYFWYDNKNRLTDFLGAYVSDGIIFGYEFWRRYIYQQNRCVGDTSYLFGWAVNGVPSRDEAIYYRVSKYTYDQYERIIKVESADHREGDPVYELTTHYSYNQQGNLTATTTYFMGNISSRYEYTNYDNKVSIHRTHRLWPFLDRNYSLNNPFRADSYNKNDLPLKTSVPAGQPVGFLYGITLNEASFTYNCK
ncbi:MAG: hypothetical protein P0Y53_19675 [Candidatus Pseudobacter hemicellulosilyticus]|uniref:YD repeat-containing protein n=1 Tax=Candidatus Pseudobacter hemicellulosilyticus TaxID=3121375 RepID=A0AAJ5WS56_9BACT|nr:MAG: hypothetical protein P0Y53_19675 [Pseudobacter sp.]